MAADSDFFDSAYRTKAPWDVGQAQPALLTLLEEFPPLDPILEVGCGTGDLALTLAERVLKMHQYGATLPRVEFEILWNSVVNAHDACNAAYRSFQTHVAEHRCLKIQTAHLPFLL